VSGIKFIQRYRFVGLWLIHVLTWLPCREAGLHSSGGVRGFRFDQLFLFAVLDIVPFCLDHVYYVYIMVCFDTIASYQVAVSVNNKSVWCSLIQALSSNFLSIWTRNKDAGDPDFFTISHCFYLFLKIHSILNCVLTHCSPVVFYIVGLEVLAPKLIPSHPV
jgi:hypothetical protein